MAKFQFGTAGWVGFITSAGGTIDLTVGFQEISWETNAETVDVTSGNSIWNEIMAGQRSFSASASFFMDDGSGARGTATMATLVPGTSGIFVFGTLGTAASKPKYGGSVIVTGNTMSNLGYGAQDSILAEIEFEGHGQPIWNHGSTW